MHEPDQSSTQDEISTNGSAPVESTQEELPILGSTIVPLSTPSIGFEMTPDQSSPSRGVGVRISPNSKALRGKGVRMMGGTVGIPSCETSSSEPGVSNSRLRTINGKIVRWRGKGDGSKAHRYPGGIKPLGYGVSWDPVDGEAMLGVSIYTSLH